MQVTVIDLPMYSGFYSSQHTHTRKYTVTHTRAQTQQSHIHARTHFRLFPSSLLASAIQKPGYMLKYIYVKGF